MDKPSLPGLVSKLAIAGEQAGFTIEQMIRFLNAGVSVEDLLRLIESRLNKEREKPVTLITSSRWIM